MFHPVKDLWRKNTRLRHRPLRRHRRLNRISGNGPDFLTGAGKKYDMGDVKNLTRQEGNNKLKEIAMAARVCHFTTSLDKKPLSSRPMTTLDVDAEGNFWFLSMKSSHKNHDIESDPEVQLFYANTDQSEFLSVFGYAEEVHDRGKLEELWNPIARNWFNEGKDDPEISIIKVNVADAYYWDTKNNRMIQLVKMAAGAVAGKRMDDGIEGRISS